MNDFPISRLWLVVGGGGLVLCLIALLSTYTFLPSLLGNMFGESIKNEMGLQTTPEVSLESDPPPTMLAGNFAQGQVSLAQADFEDVRPRRVTIDLDPFDLNVMKSMQDGELASQEPLSGNLRMEISENEVARLADSSTEDFSVEGAELEENQISVESATQVLGVEVPVVVQGDMEIRDQQLVFEPQQVSALGIRLPDRLAEELLSEADFSYPLEDLPYDASISDIEVKQNYLVLSGRLENIPLGSESG